jgi:5'-nucleotidase/UDP-sugar diphosphatase
MRKAGWLALALMVAAAVVLAGYGLFAVATSIGVRPDATLPAAKDGGPPLAAEPTERIVILHTNDFHGAIEPREDGAGGQTGGLINLVSLIDQLRAEDPDHTLLLDAGDTFQGTYVSNSTRGEVVMAAMNVAGYDAWTLGNHEFDWGQEVLRARIDQARFPALAANLLDADSGQAWDGVEPYVILQVGRARVAVLGLTYPDTPAINEAENVAGLDFWEPLETLRRYLPELEEQADLIVVLSHAGYDNDLALAEAVDGIDVIVGGHSHLFIESPRIVNDTLIVQAGAKGQVVGRLEVTLDLATGRVTDWSRHEVLRAVTGDVPRVNAEVKSLVDAAEAEAAATMSQPIGETVRALEVKTYGEFALGNLVADAMLAAEIDGHPADMALHNNGGIRASLPRGSIDYGQVYAVLPFDDQLMALDLTGEQALRILERSVAASSGKLQVAGVAFRFSMSRPVGQRVQEVTVGGKPLDLKRVYRVVTIDYLAAGGDGYKTFLEGTNPAYGDSAVWALAEYIRSHSPLDPQVEGRIVQQ